MHEAFFILAGTMLVMSSGGVAISLFLHDDARLDAKLASIWMMNVAIFIVLFSIAFSMLEAE